MQDPWRSLETLLSRQLLATRWQPAADVYRLAEGWLVKIELAGVRPDEFELSLVGQQMVLRGRRRDWQGHETAECQSLEIIYDEFERRFEFPMDLSSARVETEYSNGMLIVRIMPIRNRE